MVLIFEFAHVEAIVGNLDVGDGELDGGAVDNSDERRISVSFGSAGEAEVGGVEEAVVSGVVEEACWRW